MPCRHAERWLVPWTTDSLTVAVRLRLTHGCAAHCSNRDRRRRRPSSQGMSRTAPLSICWRSEEHTSELQSHLNLVCRLLLEKKKNCVATPAPVIHTLTSPVHGPH